MHVVEIFGIVIVVAALAEAVIAVGFSTVRRARSAARQELALRLFREQAEVHLDAARAQRDRAERSWQGARKFVVASKKKEARGVHSFELVPHDRRPLPPFLPGQHVTVQLRLANRPKPVVRCYSLSDSPRRLDRYRITVKRVDEGGRVGVASGHLCDDVGEGDIIDLLAPSGQFVLDVSRDRPVVLVGAGVGITPVLCMARAIADSGRPRETWLLLGMRSLEEYPLRSEVEALQRSMPNLRVELFLTDPEEGLRLGRDYQHDGRISFERLQELLPSSNYQFFLCGPAPMADTLSAALQEWGVPAEDVAFEAFGPASLVKPRADRQPAEVVFARSGQTATWTEGSGTLLEMAEVTGVAIDSGCRAGSCGSCLTAVREGRVEPTAEPGFPPEPGSCLTCISVPDGRVVLDA